MKKLVLLIAVGTSLATFATNYTWTGGGGDGRWTTPANWGGSGYPSGTSDAVIFNTDATVLLDTDA